MPNTLILSNNEVFKNDLTSQIKYHAPEFKIVSSEADAPDIVIIDNNVRQAENWKEAKIPVIFLVLLVNA